LQKVVAMTRKSLLYEVMMMKGNKGWIPPYLVYKVVID